MRTKTTKKPRFQSPFSPCIRIPMYKSFKVSSVFLFDFKFVFFYQTSDDENSDNSNECVVCLSDLRDTLILPCRHLCLCNSCADTLRYQANNCPICRLRKKRRKRSQLKYNGFTLLLCFLMGACVCPPSLQSLAADQSCEEKARCSVPGVLQPRPGSDDGP